MLCPRTFKIAINGIWSDLEAHVGLWCSCFPAISAIVRVVSYKLGFRSNIKSQPTASNAGYYGNPGASARANQWKYAKDGYVMSGTGIDKDSDSQRAIVAHGGGTELRNLQEGHIYKHTEFSVQSQPELDKDAIHSDR